jgi:hypothetical protein
MRCLRWLALAIFIAGASLPYEARSQPTAPPAPEPPEYLSIQTDQPAKVYLRPSFVRTRDGNGTTKNNARFGPYDAGPHAEPIRLPGFEPFGIEIHSPDGVAYTASSIYLCKLIKKCIQLGFPQEEDIELAAWRNVNGKYRRDPERDKMVRITSDATQVVISLAPLAGKADPRPVPPRPKKKQ